MTFYDKNGKACCYADDFVHIYDFNGEPLGYISNSRIWNYSGRYLGLFRNGWIIDGRGNHLLFSESATGGPQRPLRSLSPLKGLKKLRPLKSVREVAPVAPVSSLNWSNSNYLKFFKG